jgi:lycopene cyclase domain-containing protein
MMDWQPATYLTLIVLWALPPLTLQLAFGADILWRYRSLIFFSIVPLTLYLSLADALAIGWGTWTIDPAKSINFLLGGVLPIEEFIFFLLTTTLAAFGIVLVLAEASHERIATIREGWLRQPVVRSILDFSYKVRDGL